MDFGGRPTKYEYWMADKAYEILSEGKLKIHVAAELGICKDTMYEWIKENKRFSDAIKAGIAVSEALWHEKSDKEISNARWIFTGKNSYGWRDNPNYVTTDLTGSYKQNSTNLANDLKDGKITADTYGSLSKTNIENSLIGDIDDRLTVVEESKKTEKK